MRQIANQADEQIAVTRQAEKILREYQTGIYKRTDRLFAKLMIVQWIAGIAAALWISPRTWAGSVSGIHVNVWAAIFLGGAITAFPVVLAWRRPGDVITRHVIAAAQMLTSALLIHLTGGRIETHFHVFGSLAFLAVYRDWRVLLTATVVVALDHMFRGLFWPLSVFGVLTASPWRWMEHAGWVLFENIFLVVAIRQSLAEMSEVALRRAKLESTNAEVERQVVERTAQLEDAHRQLVDASRQAGMAEVATGVLHNVGNVLNSVNVSANVIAEKMGQSPVANLVRATEMIEEHKDDLGAFLTADAKGRQIPGYFCMVSKILRDENTAILGELTDLSRGIEHIKQIVQLQQDYAKPSNVLQRINPAGLIEDALRINQLSLERHKVEVVREIADVGLVDIDKHKTLQILINLISNARNALKDRGPGEPFKIMLRMCTVEERGKRTARFEVIDNGVGIGPEILSKIFQHGFTTRAGGHGFGLHSAVNAAREMGGSLTAASDGLGRGARFTLDIPLAVNEVTA